MINEQMQNSEGFVNRVDYVCANVEKDIDKRPFVHFLGGNIVAGDPFIRYTNALGEQVVDVDTAALIGEMDAHAAKYKGQSKELCAHFVLSLATGESLSRRDLLESARHYMKSMGYGNGSKWFAVEHQDTDNIHIHIVACRAQMVHSDVSPDGRPRPPQFSVVKDSNSYQKGWEACREIEQKFGLQVVENPEQCFGKNGDSFKRGIDQSKILRGIIGDVWKEGKPKTFSDLILRLNGRGVMVQGVTEIATDGLVKGILFRLDRSGGRWISGSKLKATRLTFDKLIEKEGINYLPSRDNALLGLPPNAYTLVKNAAANPPSAFSGSYSTLLRAYVKIPEKNKRIAAYVKNKGRAYGVYSDSDGMYLGFNSRLNINFCKKTKAQVEAEIEAERIAKLVLSLMKMVKSALNDIFRGFIIQVEMYEPQDELTDTALRLKVPVTLDAASTFEQHSEMEAAVDEQVAKQMSHLASVLSPASEPTMS